MKKLEKQSGRLASRAQKGGFTLTELAIVLGVAGIILAGIWIASSSVNQAKAVNQAVQAYQAVSQNIFNLQQNRPFTGGAQNNITGSLISSSAIPGWLVTDATHAMNPWDANGFVVWADPMRGGAGTGTRVFRISFYDIPASACISILTQAINCDVNQAVCPTWIYTAGSPTALPTWSMQAPTAANGGWQGSFDPSTAATACGNNAAYPAAGAANSVEFDFQL